MLRAVHDTALSVRRLAGYAETCCAWRRRPSQRGAKNYLLQQLGVAHGEAAAQPILVGLVGILVRDICLRQAVAHSGVHIITPREEIVQCFMESYEAVLPQMKRSTARVR